MMAEIIKKMMDQITFITGNPAKAERVKKYLPVPLSHKAVDLPEIQSLDLHEVVEHKAREAYSHVSGPVLVEDTSLRFTALGKLPGTLIKWFLFEINNQGLCKLLDGYDDRSATAEVCFGLYDGDTVHFFDHQIAGTIAAVPRGGTPFGFDSIFIPNGSIKTWGEMSEEETTIFSMRRPALEKLNVFLSSKK